MSTNKHKYTIDYKGLVFFLVFAFLLIGGFYYFTIYNKRNFETKDDCRKWIEDKHFESVGNDMEQMDIKGNLSMPVGTLELKFDGNLMTYQGCQPEPYEVYKDFDNWVVGFKKCGDGDLVELIIPGTGDIYVRSMDYDISKKEEMAGSVINRLDAAASKQTVNGPVMIIK